MVSGGAEEHRGGNKEGRCGGHRGGSDAAVEGDAIGGGEEPEHRGVKAG